METYFHLMRGVSLETAGMIMVLLCVLVALIIIAVSARFLERTSRHE